ncbi:MAG: hypothetical protein RSD59_04490, partial [Lactococcus sp.]
FALSFADIVRLSTPEGPFPTMWARGNARGTAWWTRPPVVDGTRAWSITAGPPRGRLVQTHSVTLNEGPLGDTLGVRPALIINQPN